jgi:hypothetical protein
MMRGAGRDGAVHALARIRIHFIQIAALPAAPN